ncbi:hypothetical protein ACHAWU_002021 [Discostella pseudostelligera]|uniref:Fe2OG dioxygenase domain-containing protein n=1 Tax=Discostella pseudostelligera TaxID=259834 RepID=A0ABD3N053_9STRA
MLMGMVLLLVGMVALLSVSVVGGTTSSSSSSRLSHHGNGNDAAASFLVNAFSFTTIIRHNASIGRKIYFHHAQHQLLNNHRRIVQQSSSRDDAPSLSSPSILLFSSSSSHSVIETASSSVDEINNIDSHNTNSISTPHPLILPEHIRTIKRGGVAILPNWLPSHLISSMKTDAQTLFESGHFQPDGLTNTAIKSQNFSVKADRQTFRGGGGGSGEEKSSSGWYNASIGNITARLEFANRMDQLRQELSLGLDRPTLFKEEHEEMNTRQRHEITYNWYEPGAKLGRHLDEHHEEMKGPKGWMLPTRRSVTWLVYLNDHWNEDEGGALRCFPRSEAQMDLNGDAAQVGAQDGNLQVGWVNGGADPVFLDCFRPSGMAALYQLVRVSAEEGKESGFERRILSVEDFDVPSMQPIEFAPFLLPEVRDTFTQISTSRLDPRFAGSSSSSPLSSDSIDFDCSDESTILDVLPTAGTLVLFDSVSLPHLVREVTGKRQRIAATGWFHEDSQFVLEI